MDKSAIVDEIIKRYLQPSFGSMSKHDIDLLMFDVLQQCGEIEEKPNIFDVMKKLRVTRSKARNLIYESAIRQGQDLEIELKNLLERPILSKDSNRVAIEIDNPLLIDYIRKELKNLNHITDGSFAPELVRMDFEAFCDLYFKVFPEKNKKIVDKELINLGLKNDTSLKAIMPKILKGLAVSGCKLIIGETGANLVERGTDFLIESLKAIKKENHDDVYDIFKDFVDTTVLQVHNA